MLKGKEEDEEIIMTAMTSQMIENAQRIKAVKRPTA
jgi:hypothetical protein